MVKLVEVTDEQGEDSADPKDIIHHFLESEMRQAKIDEKEIGRTDKRVNNFMARTRVYLKYHKLHHMVDISRKRPYIYFKRVDLEEVEEDVNRNDTVEENTVDAAPTPQ